MGEDRSERGSERHRAAGQLQARDPGVLLGEGELAGEVAEVVRAGGRREGDRSTEAAAGRRYVVARGVPDSAVLLESEGRTTSESLRAVAALLGELARTAPPGGVPPLPRLPR